jgi:hypothetical protein
MPIETSLPIETSCGFEVSIMASVPMNVPSPMRTPRSRCRRTRNVLPPGAKRAIICSPRFQAPESATSLMRRHLGASSRAATALGELKDLLESRIGNPNSARRPVPRISASRAVPQSTRSEETRRRAGSTRHRGCLAQPHSLRRGGPAPKLSSQSQETSDPVALAGRPPRRIHSFPSIRSRRSVG